MRGSARAWILFAGTALVALVAGASSPARAQTVSIEVTSTGDVLEGADCPSATMCTLRRAIVAANLTPPVGSVQVTFAPALFPKAQPAVIQVGAVPLPPVTRDDVSVDATGRGVVLQGPEVLNGAAAGLALSGARDSVFGLQVRRWGGACILATGASAAIGESTRGLELSSCLTGIQADGPASVIRGNEIQGVSVGVWATASNTTVGGAVPLEGNAISFGATGVTIGGTGLATVSGIRVIGNTLRAGAGASPQASGVRALNSVAGAVIEANTILDAVTGVAIQGNAVGPSASRVTVSNNEFVKTAGLPIDLDADAQRNPNDDGDLDVGANGLRNSPVFTRAVQSRISGTACPGCRMELYLEASDGEARSFKPLPGPGGSTVADASGQFAFDSPGLPPGTWVSALATDPEGNTSEFSLASRVGAGSLQCGNALLEPGWNLVGYFGAEPLDLGARFPADPSAGGPVAAIYHLNDGGERYSRWLADASVGRTLLALRPGDAYWMFATAPAVITGGFSLSVPVPVQLRAGWNTFVYFGATASGADALQSIAGKFEAFYAWDTQDQAWARGGESAVPTWARDFSEVRACGAYQVLMTQDAVLLPLQP